jgi:hypothetical protein
LDLILLINRIADAVLNIDTGRKGFAIIGKEREGRIAYEKGIAKAMSTFKEASNLRFAKSADPQAIIFAEYSFITQEFQFCPKDDKDSINSLTKAIQNFDDAFLALQIVENKTHYQNAEKTYSHDKKQRIKEGYPLDAFHFACRSHEARIKNLLKFPGIDPIEKALLKQRLLNLSIAQQGYIEKQKMALE